MITLLREEVFMLQHMIKRRLRHKVHAKTHPWSPIHLFISRSFILVVLAFSFFPFTKASALPPSSKVERLIVTLRWSSDVELDLRGTFCSGINRIHHINRKNTRVSGLGRFITRTRREVSIVATPPSGSTCYFHVIKSRRKGNRTHDETKDLGAEVILFENGRHIKTFFTTVNRRWNIWSVFSHSDGEIVEINKFFESRFDTASCLDPKLILIPGDILLGAIDESLVPGRWSHVGLYIGNGEVIEAFSADEPVSIRPTSQWSFPQMKWVTYLRVSSADARVRKRAVEFAIEQFGKPYNKNIFNKRLDGDSWYCSELIWAAYMKASGGKINLDRPSFPFGVYPWEIEKSQHVTNIGGHYERPPKRSWKIAAYALRLVGRESLLILSENLKPKPVFFISAPLFITGLPLVLSFLLAPEVVIMLRVRTHRRKNFIHPADDIYKA